MRIPVSIHPLFWLFAILIGVINSMSVAGTAIWVVVILVSLLVHEFGHALTALAFGQKPRIQLMIFGGVTYRDGPDIGLGRDFLVTLNGPLAGFGLGALAWVILHFWTEPPEYIAMALHITFLVNVFWTVINLLPILPLDGGHLLRIVLEALFGAKGASIALLTGGILGAALTITSLILGVFLVGILFFLLTFESFRAWKTLRYFAESDRSEPLQRQFQDAQQKAIQGHTDEALAELEKIRAEAGKGLLYQAATEEAAQILKDTGQPEKAYAYLTEIKSRLSPRSLPIYHELAYKVADYTNATKMGNQVYQLAPTAHVAYVNALAHAALSEAEAAIGWLRCAERAGMPNLTSSLSNPEFDKIRQDPTFRSYVESLSA